MLKGKVVEPDLIEKCKEISEIEIENVDSLDEANLHLEEAKKDWNEMLSNRKEYREIEIMDFYHTDILNEIEQEKKLRNKIINRIKRNMNRKYSFYYISKYAGKEVLHIKNQ